MMQRHLNVFNKECVIVMALRRGKHFTKEFEAFAPLLMNGMPVKKAGGSSAKT